MKKVIVFIFLILIQSYFVGQTLAPVSPQATMVVFNYTGGPQNFTVSPDLCVNTLTIVARGAKGGGAQGGNGAAIQSTISVTPGQVLQINVGGLGTQGNASGGFNGGGTGYASTGSFIYSSCGGGGASDVRVAPYALANRVIVAGGGGGQGGGSGPVCGGAANCNNGANGCNTYGSGGGGGTQVAGGTAGVPWAGTPPGGSPGALGIGGQGGLWQTASGGGGGGGYYGGGGGGNDGCCTGANGGGGGGGGSSFYPAGSVCQGGSNALAGKVEIYYIPGTKPLVNESYAICTRSAPNLNTFSLSAQVTATTAAAVLTFSWVGPGGFNSVTNSTATAINPALTPTVGSYITQTSPGPGTVISTFNLLTPNPTTLASGIYTIYTGYNGTVAACSNTVQIMVNQTPTISVLGANSPTCQGSTLNFSATPINPTVAVAGQTVVSTYLWTGPNSFTSNLAAPSIVNSSSLNTGTYSVSTAYSYTQSLASTIFTTAAGTPSIITNTLTCKKDTSLQVIVINTVMPTSATYTRCQGANLTLSTTASGASSYSWAGVGTFTSNSQNITFNNVMPNIAGNYTATALFTHPQTTLVCSASAVSNVSIVATSPVTVNLTPNVCQYAQATFSANATTPIGYMWYGPNGYTSTAVSNTISNIQPSASGVYSVIAYFGIGTVTCSTQNSGVINVVPVASVAVIPTITLCEKDGTNFTANGQGAVSYTWTGPNTFSVIGPGAQFQNLTPSWSGIYTVTAMFTNGNLLCYNSNTTSLLVKPRLYFNLGQDKMVCNNDNIILNGPAGATSYNWYSSTSYTNNTQTAFIPGVHPINSGLYVLEVDLNGCKTYDSVNVQVLTPIQFSLTPNNKTVCRNDSVKFTVGCTGGSENYAYNWNPAIFITTPNFSVQAGQALGTTIYNVTAYDIACPNYTIQHTFTLTVDQPPVPKLNLDKNNECEPLCMLYDSKTKGESKLVTYDFGNGQVLQGDSLRICLNAGQYFLKVYTVGNNGCKGVFDYSVPITVYPKPQSDFYWNPEQPTTSNGDVTFYPTVQHGTLVTYNWQFMNTASGDLLDTTTVKNPIRLYTNNGKFPIMLSTTNEYGCSDTIYKVIEILEDVNVYIPNTFTPNDDNLNDVFNIKGVGLKSENYYMEIFDRWGTLVYSTKDINKGWDGTIKGNKAADGVYIYQIRVIAGNNQGKKEFKGHVTLMK